MCVARLAVRVRKDMLRKPFGAMVSSADLVPAAPSA